MRDLMLLGALLILVPLALRSTFAAFLMWSWTAGVAINTYVYGFMVAVPFNLVFALITLLLFVMGKDQQQCRFSANRTSTLFLLFSCQALLSAALAYSSATLNWELCFNLLKIILFCLLMPMLVTSRYRFHAMLIVLALAYSFHGLLEGLKFLVSGGAHRWLGNAKFGDNNHAALVMVMIVPILLYLAQYSARRWARWSFFGVAVTTVLSVVSTNSRGGLISLAVMAVWIALYSRRKTRNFMAIASAAILLLALAPDAWTERMDSIQYANQDASFIGRVVAWKISSAIALENPLTGGGFRSLQAYAVWDQFRHAPGFMGMFATPEADLIPRAAHSIYFEVMSDLGFVGLLLFLLILYTPFALRRQIAKLIRESTADLQWAGDASNALSASMLVFAVGGAALSASYFELMYIVAMLMQALKIQVERLTADPAGIPAGAGARRGSELQGELHNDVRGPRTIRQEALMKIRRPDTDHVQP